MTKDTPADLSLKLRMRRILFSQGYWSPIEVELSNYDHLGTTLKRQSLTDVDVLGIRFDRLFAPNVVVADCKSGKNVSDTNRLFWLRGVMAYFGADEAYFVRSRIASHARSIAPKMGLRVMDDGELALLEKAIGADGIRIPLADIDGYTAVTRLWGIDVPDDRKPTREELILKDVYSYLSYAYWYMESHRRLLALIGRFERAAHLLNSDDQRHVLLGYVGAERFAHCLLDIVSRVQAQGGADIIRSARIYLYGGTLGLREKEQFFELLRKATGTQESLDPHWLPDVLELVGRLLRNPAGAADVLRYLSALYLWCVRLGNQEAPVLDSSNGNTAALVLAKDVASTFVKVAGLPEAIFSAIKGL